MIISLLDRKPQLVWKFFNDILKIPRPSGKEERIRKWLLNWARQDGFPAETDKTGNVVIRIPATSGKETSPIVVLQAHMDMVCEKNRDKDFNFEKDPIDVVINGEWLCTKGTSMGADNGIGIASALAISVDRDAIHGPLELLFTVDEERGLNGAFNLQPGFIKGRILLNLDSEEEGTFFIGCAGGGESMINFPLTFTSPPKKTKGLKIKLTGMKGGHSGLNIHENRANAIKTAVRLLKLFEREKIAYALASIEGGDKHNAIPRECTIEIAIEESQMEKIQNAVEKFKKIFSLEFEKTDPEFKIEMQQSKKAPAKVMSPKCKTRLLQLLTAIPHGVVTMSRDIKGLVETSNNLASISTKKKTALIVTSTRSSISSALEFTRDMISDISSLAGATVTKKPAYPGWQPNMSSSILKKAQEVYLTLFGKQPCVTAVHAGLECGIIGEKYPGIDMISFGPTLSGVHSPEEKLHLESVENFYRFLKELLKSI